jgi:sulfoxide reductase heme-binding subunit YedZ
MSQPKSSTNQKRTALRPWGTAGIIMALLALVGALVASTPFGAGIVATLNSIFVLDSVKTTWFVTRASGIVAYLLMWFSMVWGLAVASKFLDRLMHRAYEFDFHEYLSLLAIGFLVLHIVMLLFDQYLTFSVAQILIPFIAPYRPVWVGIGVVALYLTLLASVTFYLRNRIGMAAFRVIHLSSFVAYLGATVHGLMSGTDSKLVATQFMYAGTFPVVVVLTAYWWKEQRKKKVSARLPSSSTLHRHADA